MHVQLHRGARDNEVPNLNLLVTSLTLSALLPGHFPLQEGPGLSALETQSPPTL